MIVNEERKTTVKQRIIILVIAAFLLFSTAALYVGIVLNIENSETKATITNEKATRFEKLYSEYQGKVNEQGKEIAKQYFDQFKGYKSRVKAFNAASSATLEKTDLATGDGREIKYTRDDDGNIVSYDADYAAFYIGWLSDETVFDSSFDSASNPTSLKAPLNGNTNMIQGWLEGIEGMRIGGVREITIPPILGYGDTDQGTIPANSPLKFVVMLIEKPAAVEVPDELEELGKELYNYSIRANQ